MFERFTERARQVIVLGQDEARALKHNYIGAEHFLLGLIREENGIGARVLADLNVTLEDTRAYVKRTVGEGDRFIVTGQIPFTPRAKKITELSLREALSLGHNYIGTEHILLGLVRETEGVVAAFLREQDIDPEAVRDAVLRMLPKRAKPAPEGVANYSSAAVLSDPHKSDMRAIADALTRLAAVAEELVKPQLVIEKRETA